MSGRCGVCGGRYLGGRVCERASCPRNGRSRRELFGGPADANRGDQPEEEPAEEEAELEEIQRATAALQTALEDFIRRRGSRRLRFWDAHAAIDPIARMLGLRLRHHR